MLSSLLSLPMGMLRTICVGLALSTSLVEAATFFTEFSQLPSDTYDFIVVGGAYDCPASCTQS